MRFTYLPQMAIFSVAFLTPSISAEMQKEDKSCDYSDHSLLSLKSGEITIVNLNIGQTGRLQLFPAKNEVGFVWASTFRSVDILMTLNLQQNNLNEIGLKLKNIAQDPSLSLEEKNIQISSESEKIQSDLEKLGFTIKSFSMAPYQIFNETPAYIMWKDPDKYTKYVQGPLYYLENTMSYQSRLARGFSDIMKVNPDIITCQEIELGGTNGIDLSMAQEKLTETYPDYHSIKPKVNSDSYLITNVTYYNKKTIEDISNLHQGVLDTLRDKTKSFIKDPNKLLSHALKHRSTGEIYYVLNFHCDYGSMNTEGTWEVVRDLLSSTPGLIIVGDFNVQLKNRSFIEKAIDGLSVDSLILQTPEPEEIGNPTYDAIFIAR